MEDIQQTGTIEPSTQEQPSAKAPEPTREELVEALNGRIAEATQLMRAAAQGVEEAKQVLVQATGEYDKLVTEREVLQSKENKNQANIVAYLKKQNELREARGRELQQLRDAGLGKFVGDGKCALDRAMSRRSGRGDRRPVRDLIAPNG